MTATYQERLTEIVKKLIADTTSQGSDLEPIRPDEVSHFTNLHQLLIQTQAAINALNAGRDVAILTREVESIPEIDAAVAEGRREENQMHLDRINNYNPKPGQLTSASFGSAGAAMEIAGWKRAFENRIAQLTPPKQEGRE